MIWLLKIDSVMSIYRRNGQCTGRSRHSTDYQEVSKYLEEHKVHDTRRTKVTMKKIANYSNKYIEQEY